MTLTHEEEQRKLLSLMPQLVETLYPKPAPVACTLCDEDVTIEPVKLAIDGRRMCGRCFGVMNQRESLLVRLARWVLR